MFAIRAAAALVVLAALPALPAADLDKARRLIQWDQADAALGITTAALAEDPHDPVAHALRLRALFARGRTREAIPPLDAWAAESPDDPRPLRILVGAYTLLNDPVGLASVRGRAATLPEEARRDVLRALTQGQLAAGFWKDAAESLAVTPPAVGDDPTDQLFRALDAARRGERGELFKYLGANGELYDASDGEFVWWIHKILDLAPQLPPAPKKTDAQEEVAGGVVGSGRPLFPTADVVLPVILTKVEPIYPDVALRARIEGKVTVQAVILTSGRTAGLVVLASSNPMFNDAARRAILQWLYKPATQEGRPVAIYFTILVHFKLRRGEK